MGRFRFSTTIVVVLVLLAWSDRVRAADYPAMAPAIEMAQELGSTLARMTDAAVGDLTRQLPALGAPGPAGRPPFSPVLLLGGMMAFAVDALRARARRDRARGRSSRRS